MFNRRLPPPIATQNHYVEGVLTLWVIKWPGRQGRTCGKTYLATTYPESDHIFIETAVKRRPVSELQGRKILPQIRDAIARAAA